MRHFYTIFDPSFVGWTSRNSPEFFFLNARQCVLFPKAAQWQMRIWSCKLQQLHLIQIYVYILCILYEHIIFRFILSILYYIVLVFGSCTRCWLPREQTEMCIFKIHERCWARLSVHQMLRWVMAFWMTIQRKSCVWKCPQSTTMIYLAQVSKKTVWKWGPRSTLPIFGCTPTWAGTCAFNERAYNNRGLGLRLLGICFCEWL